MAKQVEIPKKIKGLTKEMYKNPLLLLDSRRELYWWRYMLECRYFRLTHRVNSAKKVNRTTRDELELVTGLLDLVRLLESIQQYENSETAISKVIEHYQDQLRQQKQHYEDMLEQGQQAFDKMVSIATEAQTMAHDCLDMIHEDAPVKGEWLSAVNLAMRLQRPHKSN